MTDRIASTSLLLATAALLDPPRDARERLAARIGDAVLQACGGGWRLLRHGARHPLGRRLLRACEAGTIPGLAVHYRWRKRHLAAWAEQAVRDGAEQLLVLGAGFDALAAHLAQEYRSLRAIEVDRSATVRLKRDALAGLGGLPPTLQHVGLELDTADALAHVLPALARDARTVIVAEGVLMYLAPDAARALVQRLAAHVTHPPLFLATAMQCHDGRVGFLRQTSLASHWLRRHDEAFRWGIDMRSPDASLATIGLACDAFADPDAAANPDPAPGEWLFRARAITDSACSATSDVRRREHSGSMLQAP